MKQHHRKPVTFHNPSERRESNWNAEGSEILVRRNLQCSPSQRAWQSPELLSLCWCHLRSRKPLLQRNAVPALWLLFHVVFWPRALAVPWESREVSGGDRSAPEAKAGKNSPTSSSRWPPPCSPSSAPCFRHPAFHSGNEEHSSKLLP